MTSQVSEHKASRARALAGTLSSVFLPIVAFRHGRGAASGIPGSGASSPPFRAGFRCEDVHGRFIFSARGFLPIQVLQKAPTWRYHSQGGTDNESDRPTKMFYPNAPSLPGHSRVPITRLGTAWSNLSPAQCIRALLQAWESSWEDPPQLSGVHELRRSGPGVRCGGRHGCCRRVGQALAVVAVSGSRTPPWGGPLIKEIPGLRIAGGTSNCRMEARSLRKSGADRAASGRAQVAVGRSGRPRLGNAAGSWPGLERRSPPVPPEPRPSTGGTGPEGSGPWARSRDPVGTPSVASPGLPRYPPAWSSVRPGLSPLGGSSQASSTRRSSASPSSPLSSRISAIRRWMEVAGEPGPSRDPRWAPGQSGLQERVLARAPTTLRRVAVDSGGRRRASPGSPPTAGGRVRPAEVLAEVSGQPAIDGHPLGSGEGSSRPSWISWKSHGLIGLPVPTSGQPHRFGSGGHEPHTRSGCRRCQPPGPFGPSPPGPPGPSQRRV